MKTTTEIINEENQAIDLVKSFQASGDYSSDNYKAAVKEYKKCVRARQKMVRETKAEILRLYQSLNAKKAA